MATLIAGSDTKIRPTRRARARWVVPLIILCVLAVAVGGVIALGSLPGGNLLTDQLSAPLNGGTSARIDIHSDTGHLTIDQLTGSEQVLAAGTLQYFEHQGVPVRSVSTSNGQASFTLKGGGSPRTMFTFPWSACAGGAYEWQVHLNPTVSSDITAYSGGGNLKLTLAALVLTRLWAETAGGNINAVLPDNAADLAVTAKTGGGNINVDLGSGTTGSSTLKATSGAGNVVVHVPGGVSARIHATSGLGQVVVDPRFSKVDGNTYQSAGYDSAARKIEITLSTGAGNAVVNTK